MKTVRFLFVVVVGGLILIGCGKPNAVNIQLRKENHELRSKLEDLERREKGHASQIRALESRGSTTAPSLSSEHLDRLFTTHGIKLGRLTGPADLDPKTPGNEGLKVYAVPTDAQGQPLKAAGSFVVEAFDLAKGENNRVGRWEFPLDQAEKNWFGQAMLYTYVLSAPWQGQPPQADELTLRVAFTDALTGRTFTEQKVVRLKSP
jgi:outer membrane murein-binding lipoprotein Lpp